MAQDRIGVLFICLGNICRSPLAEGVFRALVHEAGLDDRFRIDSAGTSGYHAGEPPDSRTVAVARDRGITLDRKARQVEAGDLGDFDYLVVMDAANLTDVRRMAAGIRPDADVRLLRSFDPDAAGDLDVPDPYFGGPSGFRTVQRLVERACRGLLEHIRREHAL
jgi:protein-tyrosine phosphatase